MKDDGGGAGDVGRPPGPKLGHIHCCGRSRANAPDRPREGVEIVSKSLLSKTTLAALALLVGVSTVGCAHKKPDPMDSVSGVIVKPDYMHLGPNAVAHVRLADVTKGYVESETVVEKTVRPGEDGSIPFTL